MARCSRFYYLWIGVLIGLLWVNIEIVFKGNMFGLVGVIAMSFSIGFILASEMWCNSKYGYEDDYKTPLKVYSASVEPYNIDPERVRPFCKVNMVHKHYRLGISFNDENLGKHYIDIIYCPLRNMAKALNILAKPLEEVFQDPDYEEKTNHWGE